MARQKLQRFAEFEAFDNTLTMPKGMAGLWCARVFEREAPIVLELGCGKGEYAVALGARHPEKNIIGVDIQGERLWYGAKWAREKELPHVRFLRGYIDHITDYFGEDEVDEIWITFPDPQPRSRNEKKRLTSQRFLDRYKQILRPGGLMHLKTDSVELFAYTREVLEEESVELVSCIEGIDLDALDDDDILRVQTTFEKKFRKIDKPINYISWRFV